MKQFVFAVALLLCVGTLSAQQTIPTFESGDKVAFVGNSITHGGHYHSFIWLYYMTRFPDMPVTVYNKGIGGDTSQDIAKRIEYDVLPLDPDYVALTFGMNDVGYYDFYKADAQEIAAKNVQKSIDYYLKIEKILKDASIAKVALVGGSPYDETAKIKSDVFPTKNNAMLKIVDYQEEAAAKNGWGFVDFNRPMTEINLREQAKDSSFTLCGDGRIHPDNDGHMVMAYLFLKAQGLTGKKVAGVELDGRNGKVLAAENCKVSDVKDSKTGIEYNYLAGSLPYPLDTLKRGWGSIKSQLDGTKVIPFFEEMNQELLTVKNLKEGAYKLSIDGDYIATFSAEDLANGVNLAKCTNTPQYKQALKILMLNEERFEVEKRFRDYAWVEFSFFQNKGLLFADNDIAVDTLKANVSKNIFLNGYVDLYSKARYPEMRALWQKQMDDYVAEIYRINKPVEHKIELERE